MNIRLQYWNLVRIAAVRGRCCRLRTVERTMVLGIPRVKSCEGITVRWDRASSRVRWRVA